MGGRLRHVCQTQVGNLHLRQIRNSQSHPKAKNIDLKSRELDCGFQRLVGWPGKGKGRLKIICFNIQLTRNNNF